MFPLSPSPGNPGEGWGGGPAPIVARSPLPNPPPEYQGRGKETPLNMRLPCSLGDLGGSIRLQTGLYLIVSTVTYKLCAARWFFPKS